MDAINLAAFREPRGVMRVLHFIFSICAFATITSYTGGVWLQCQDNINKKEFDYPFYLQMTLSAKNAEKTCSIDILGVFSSDAKFFVATGVISMLYALAISVVYVRFDELYKNNNQVPLLDFVISVIIGVLWLSSSAAWANSLNGLKNATTVDLDALNCSGCSMGSKNFSTLNISVIFGFLNFFIWAADLWFLYKETAWFNGNQQQQTTSGV